MKKLFFMRLSVAVFLGYGVVHAQSSRDLIQDYYQKNAKIIQKNNPGKLGFIILNEDQSKSLHANIVNVQQTYDGLRIYNALGKVIIKNGTVVSEKNDFKKEISVAHQGNPKERFSEEMLMQKLGLQAISDIRYLPNVYFEKNNVYVLSKELFVSDKNSSDVWHVIADAVSGEILTKDNLTLACHFEQTDHGNHSEHSESASQNIKAETKSGLGTFFTPPSAASYNVFPLPTEAPSLGGRSVVNDPWDIAASPEGWHSDGTNTYTNTRGNNVYAYSDQINTNNPGYSPDGGNSLTFNYPFADGRYDDPLAYSDAAITNLFYTNNKAHDIFYKFGFTEAARNFQTSNFGKGGIEGDAVNAEAFDGSGLNNANFSSGYETVIGGTTYLLAPRMQMYLWDRAQTPDDPMIRYQYNTPASIVSRPKVQTGGAAFGPLLIGGPAVTGDLALSSPDTACTALAAGSLTGKIGIAKRGSCSFATKVKNMQLAGAIGGIIYDPVNANPLATMAADNTVSGITIPSIMMGKAEGEYLVDQMNAGTVVNTTLNFDYSGFRHSSLDNGVIVHEYGHGISNRLTGRGYSCLRSAEQMGEGWSDYFALMFTTKPGDNSSLSRAIGTYSSNQPATGSGIRPAKYSPDFSVNNFTYGRTNTLVGSHAIGFVWATMLWDLTWKYVEKYGYNSDVTANATSGNAKALQIVMDGLKLQACDPSFIDGRDAILQADVLGNAGQDKCMIWEAFAKRGLGVNASAGTSDAANDQTEDFSIPAECSVLATQEAVSGNTKFVIFPNPTYDEFFVGNIDRSREEVKIKLFDMSGKLVLSDHRESTSRKAISTRGLQKGVYMVNIRQGEKMQTEKLIVK